MQHQLEKIGKGGGYATPLRKIGKGGIRGANNQITPQDHKTTRPQDHNLEEVGEGLGGAFVMIGITLSTF